MKNKKIAICIIMAVIIASLMPVMIIAQECSGNDCDINMTINVNEPKSERDIFRDGVIGVFSNLATWVGILLLLSILLIGFAFLNKDNGEFNLGGFAIEEAMTIVAIGVGALILVAITIIVIAYLLS
jgi:hypothetical protein